MSVTMIVLIIITAMTVMNTAGFNNYKMCDIRIFFSMDKQFCGDSNYDNNEQSNHDSNEQSNFDDNKQSN